MKTLFYSIITFFIVIYIQASEINILYFNDFHGAVDQTSKAPGMIKFVSFIDNFKSTHPNTIILSGGDNYQGPIISNLTRGAVVNKMFKLIGLTASAVGNHEFDWGLKYFSKWQETGGFAFLAANILNKKDRKQVSWFKPYEIISIDNLKLAVIGLATTDTVNTTLKDNIKNLVFENPDKALLQCVENLKNLPEDQRPDVYIVISHIPSTYNDETKSVTGKEINNTVKNSKDISIFFTGHSHDLVNSKINSVPVIQAGSAGDYLINANIIVNDKAKQVKEIKITVLDVLNSNPEPLNKEAEKVYNFYKDKLQKLNQKVIGYCTADIPNKAEKYHLTPMGSTICKIVSQMSNTQVTMLNQWGLRNDLKKGKLTFGELYSVLPFDNTIVTLKISGKNLREQIEHSITLQGGAFYGVQAIYDPSKPQSEKITDFKLEDGLTIKDSEYYTLAVNNFMYAGGDKYSFTGAKEVTDTHVTLRGLVEKYIEQNKKLTPVSTDYLKIK